MVNEGFIPIDKRNSNEESWQKTFNQANQMFRDFPEFLPNTYLQYYLYPNAVIKNKKIDNDKGESSY